jgi:ubiquinone/menaquinone biosynthesis C-methylase UbiE
MRFFKVKSQQQIFLEALLSTEMSDQERQGAMCIADIACGSGSLSHHVSPFFPNAQVILVDKNIEAVQLAREHLLPVHPDFTVMEGDMYDLRSIPTESCDVVFCWMTLMFVDRPADALRELLRICKPGGRVYASSLFNFESDVDITSTFIDRTRPSGMTYQYHTFSLPLVDEWLKGTVQSYGVHRFDPTDPIERVPGSRSIGTYTVRTESGRLLQISGGMLMNWGVLEVVK